MEEPDPYPARKQISADKNSDPILPYLIFLIVKIEIDKYSYFVMNNCNQQIMEKVK